jgi:ClpP class serine protease
MGGTVGGMASLVPIFAESTNQTGGGWPTLSELFWVFLIFTLVQPWIWKRMLQSARDRSIRAIEKKRNSRVIVLIHREETMSLLGFPIFRYLDINDAEEVIRAIHLTDDEVPLDIVLHTPGGLALAALQIARAVQAHKAKVTVFVPHYAMSGGTLIALAANEIVMDVHACLGPVDPQVGEYPAASLLRVVQEKKIDEIDDKTLICADVARKALQQMRTETVELLSDKMSAEQAATLADKLSQGTWTHDHPISYHEAKALGLPVSSNIPQEFYDLMSLFPQATGRTPSVQYIPTPYGPPPAPRPHKTS